MEGGRVDSAVLRNWADTVVGGSSGTNTGSSYTADVSTGSLFHLVLNANCDFTFSNPTPTDTFCYFSILLKQGGGFTPRWPATVAWPGDQAFAMTPTANVYDLYTFFTINGGATWYGTQASADM